MQPTLCSFDAPLIGQVSFPSFLTLILAGFLVATWGTRWAAERAGLSGKDVVDFALLMLVLGVLGSRLLAVLTDGVLMDFVHLCTEPGLVDAEQAKTAYCQTDAECGYDYLCSLDARAEVDAGTRKSMCHPPRDCLAALKFWQGGLTFYGALILAIPGAMWFCRRRGLAFLRLADVAAPFVLVGQAIGRLGCFLEGCCYGAASDAPWAVAFRRGHTVHPTQLYESAVCLILAALLWFVVRKRFVGRGAVFGWMLAGYAAARFVLELWRDDPRGALGPLSTSQLLALPALAIGVWLIARSRNQPADRQEGDQSLRSSR